MSGPSRRFATGVLLTLVAGGTTRAQQVPDRTYEPRVSAATFPAGTGPVVCVDEAHHNFHTLDNRFWAFGALLRRDGFITRPGTDRFTRETLSRCGIVVISNAQPSDAPWGTYAYPTPSAFTPDEIQAVRSWVREGGKLLLIADHMPLAGAAAALAAAFGFRFNDGFAVEGFAHDSLRAAALATPLYFELGSGLREHVVTLGRDSSERVARVRSFTGQAFTAPPAAEAIMVLPRTFVSLMPRVAWQFDSTTRVMPVGEWLQGAVMRDGSGRVAVFGEAAMFTAQLAGPQRRPMGMNAPDAARNFQLALNVMRWLAGVLPATR